MHPCDDVSVQNTTLLIRAVRSDWLIRENGIERLSSAAFKESNREISCFVAEEVGGLNGFHADVRRKLEEVLGVQLIGIAMIEAQVVRDFGLWVERRPTEFYNNDAHIVICAPASLTRKDFDRAAKGLSGRAQFIPD